jgi:predicted GIY-YIG superfamily endonuclease
VINSARGTYVGQSGNIVQRFSQHLIENGGRFTQDELNAAERFGVSGGKTGSTSAIRSGHNASI